MPSSPPSAPTALLSTSAAGTIDTENNRREGGRGERSIVQIEDSESEQSVGPQDGEGGVKGNVNVLMKDVRQDGEGARQEEEEDVIESALGEETPRRSSATKQGGNGEGQAADVEGDVEMEKAGQGGDGGKEGSASNGGGKRRSSAGKVSSSSHSPYCYTHALFRIHADRYGRRFGRV
jgi:hypothetical protein